MAWHLITQGNDQNSNYMEFLIDSEEDIETPPENYSYAPTSLAHTPGYQHVYESASDGTWVEIGE